MKFYLGTHQVDWLARAGVPLMVSRVRLAGRRSLPRAVAPWVLDSGGFSELSSRGSWSVSALRYVAEARRYAAEIGRLEWAAPQDWMCEPKILARTGLTVREHQRRTIESYQTLRALAPEVPWIPVLQGWTAGDYLDCAEAYERAGVDLRAAPVVGLGTVCRRQQTLRAEFILRDLADDGLRLHGFGFKTLGLRACADVLASADSLAWSFAARREAPLVGHTHEHCASCLEFALDWRARLLGVERCATLREAA